MSVKKRKKAKAIMPPIEKDRLKSSFKAKLFLFIMTLVMCFAAGEVICRVWLYSVADDHVFSHLAQYEKVQKKHRMFSRHHYLNYCNTPNYESRYGMNKHDSLGYRKGYSDQEILIPKPAGRFRIVCLGGSSTYTIKVTDWRKAFGVLLEKKLREDYGYRDIEVINAGVGGYNSWESLINLQTRVLDLEPDIVIVYHGINDVHSRIVLPETYRGDNSGQRKQWSRPDLPVLEKSMLYRYAMYRMGKPLHLTGLEAYVNTETSYINMFGRSPEIAKICEENQPVYFRRNLENMAATAYQQGISMMFATWAFSDQFNDYVTWEHYAKGVAEHNEIVKEVALANKAALFDFASIMPKDKQYWADGRHVNEVGSGLKAGLFAEFMHTRGLIKAGKAAPVKKQEVTEPVVLNSKPNEIKEEAAEEAKEAVEAETPGAFTGRYEYGDFVIEALRSQQGEGTLRILKGGREIYSRPGWMYTFGDEDVKKEDLIIGKDITGNGKPDVVVYDYSGGAHCCFNAIVLELSEPVVEVAIIPGKHSRPKFKDLDNDLVPEVIVFDWAYEYWPSSFAFSPAPMVVLKWDKSGYRAAIEIMFKPEPTQQAIKQKLYEIVQVGEKNPGKYEQVYQEMLQYALDLMYSGHELTGWEFIDLAWPSDQPLDKRDELKGQLAELMKNSRYWPEIKANLK